MPLSTNIDTTYADDGSDASVKQHQQDHDALHGQYNAYEGTTPADFATAAQGALADTAVQPADVGTAAALDVGTGANEIPQLDGSGKLLGSIIPAVALTSVSVVADITARDALTPVEEGDVAIVLDASADPDVGSGGSTYVLDGLNAWQRIEHPNDVVTSVAGLTGVISASALRAAINVEDGADVTDAANVAAAGAHMSGGTDVPIADGGTGASTAADARTNLDVYSKGEVDSATSSAVQETAVPVTIGIAFSDETTAITAGTGKITFRLPHALTLTEVPIVTLNSAAATGTFTVDVNEGGTSILSTKITVDATEETSATATTPPVLSDSSLAANAEITVDVDDAGDGAATGGKLWLIGTRDVS